MAVADNKSEPTKKVEPVQQAAKGKAAPKLPQGSIVIPLCQRLMGIDRKVVVWKKRDDKGVQTEEELPLHEQATVGWVLLTCLVGYQPPQGKPTLIAVCNTMQVKISEKLEAGEDYVLGQAGQGVLQDAWRQAMARPANARADNTFMAQAMRCIGLKPESSDLDQTGLEE